MGRRTNETRRLAPRFPRRASKKPRCGRKAPGLKMGTKRPLASAESQPCKISIARLTLLWHGRHGTKESALPRSQEFKVITTKFAPCGPAIPRAIKGAQPSAPDLARLRSAFFGGRAPSRIVRCLFRVLVGCGASGERSYGVAVAWPPKPSVMFPKYFNASVIPTTHVTQ